MRSHHKIHNYWSRIPHPNIIPLSLLWFDSLVNCEPTILWYLQTIIPWLSSLTSHKILYGIAIYHKTSKSMILLPSTPRRGSESPSMMIWKFGSSRIYHLNSRMICGLLRRIWREPECTQSQFCESYGHTKNNNLEILLQDATIEIMGLEGRISKAATQEIIFRQKALIKAILFEQDRQIRLGFSDTDLISDISVVESDWVMKRALKIGLLHSMDWWWYCFNDQVWISLTNNLYRSRIKCRNKNRITAYDGYIDVAEYWVLVGLVRFTKGKIYPS